MMQVVQLPGHLIGPRDGARPADKVRIAAIADSIRQVGLLSPIIVAAGKRIRNGCEVDGWDVLAGMHRFKAMHTVLNWADIPCIVCDADDITMQLVTIDENLIRRDLSPAERAEQTARRKELYEALHPETAHVAFKGNQHDFGSRQNGDNQVSRFTRATAQATNLSERSIQRAAHHGEQLADVIPRIKGTSLDRSGEMDALVKLPPERREEVVKQAESGQRVSAKPSATVTPLRPPVNQGLAAALSAYDALTPSLRAEFHALRPAPALTAHSA